MNPMKQSVKDVFFSDYRNEELHEQPNVNKLLTNKLMMAYGDEFEFDMESEKNYKNRRNERINNKLFTPKNRGSIHFRNSIYNPSKEKQDDYDIYKKDTIYRKKFHAETGGSEQRGIHKGRVKDDRQRISSIDRKIDFTRLNKIKEAKPTLKDLKMKYTDLKLEGLSSHLSPVNVKKAKLSFGFISFKSFK